MPGSQCGGQHALDGAYGAGQGELAEAFEWDQGISRYLGAGSQNAKGDRQVEAAAVLWQVGRCQIQGDTARREVEGAVEDGAAHAILGFLDRGFRQPDQRQGGQAVGQVRLDGHTGGIYADLGAAMDDGQ
ncbi:hypothetical protein SRABI70_03719 [Pseudomonas sp. Bi70]|nr:hypothetical protein SRABI70_03719 [Pseudomonas sp. Bi70]